MTIANTRVRRFAAVGALAVAAAAVAALTLLADSGASTSTATGKCLAWSGSMTDGQCIAYSNGNGINVGSPGVGFGGNNNPGGLGINTAPMLPGQTFNVPLG